MTEERRGPDRVRRASIMVVDDSSTIRKIVAGRLENAGFAVVQAADGLAAIEACRTSAPDLVLLDVDMPKLDGRATLITMKADPALQDIPVMFLTANSQSDDVAYGLELGAQDYIRKTCEPAELLARVNTALRMDQMQRELKEQASLLDALSNTDPLTGLGNRRRFEQQIPSLVVDTHGGAVGFILMDIDHFKQINDTHGHAIGDVALRILAERLQGIVGEGQGAFRWGGEEFVVLAPGLDDEAVVELAEMIRVRVSGPPFAIDADRVLHVTVSLGCVSAPASRWDEAIVAADAAMYEAKGAGRNTVRPGALTA